MMIMLAMRGGRDKQMVLKARLAGWPAVTVKGFMFDGAKFERIDTTSCRTGSTNKLSIKLAGCLCLWRWHLTRRSPSGKAILLAIVLSVRERKLAPDHRERERMLHQQREQQQQLYSSTPAKER